MRTKMVSRVRLPLPVLTALGCLVSTPAAAATQNAVVSANLVRALTLSAQQNLDLGTITLSLGTWSGAVVSISRTGVRTCSAMVTCSGVAQVATYKVTGSNKMVVKINAPNVVLVNQSDATKKITLNVDSPGEITLTTSGQPGTLFNLGGSITLDSTTATGTYSGTFQVSVEYQ